MNATDELIAGINDIPELYILGKPVMSVFSYRSNKINAFALADVMERKGWHLDRLQYPAALHQMVNPHHSDVVKPFLKDLKESVDEIVENPQDIDDGSAAMYGMVASMPDRKKVKDYLLNFVKSQYKVK